MALIKCANCGHMISDRAVRCPKCGNEVISQMNNDIKNIQTPKKIKKVIEIDEGKLKKDNWAKTSIVLAVSLILIVVFVASQYGFGGFGIYGIVVLAIVSILLVCKGIAAINYQRTGNAKMVLYYLKQKGMTYLLFLLSITGIIACGIDTYQYIEYDKLVGASQSEPYSLFKKDAPNFVEWSYCKWNEDDKILAYLVTTPFGKEEKGWSDDVNEIAISAHLCNYNAAETQSPFRLSIVHNMRNERRGLSPDAILLGFTNAHQELFSFNYDYDEKVPVNIKFDDDTTFEFQCHYTSNRDEWYALLIYGKQYEKLLEKLKSGKYCSIQIGDVDKIYKFNIEGLNWGAEKKDENKTVEAEKQISTVTKATNLKSEVEITPQFIEKIRKYDKLGSYSEGLALAQRNKKWGYIDVEGNEVIPCQFDGEIRGGHGHSFSDGLAIILKNGKHGYIDKTGNIVIDAIYDEVGDFSEGIACVQKNYSNNLIFIDKQGKEIKHLSDKFIWDWNLDRKLPKFRNGVCRVHVLRPKDERYEGDFVDVIWINTNGEQVSPPHMEEENEDLILYWSEEDGAPKMGYKDKEGDVVIPAKYSSIGDFSNGVAVASLKYGMESMSGSTTDGYFAIYGYVNMNGEDTFTDDDFQRIENAYRNNPNP